jgi:succinylglutamate desuccinylase
MGGLVCSIGEHGCWGRTLHWLGAAAHMLLQIIHRTAGLASQMMRHQHLQAAACTMFMWQLVV